ncbi:hypothetical protein BDV33DRAFT_183340 [Aspergillus novoparasiticus]|uniref:Uncharacterized protein n=1 Tax=Aspergillus novoparasiticus TaxID=986946 RepID=A0A5N6E9Z7_9EURO|nr:hypothetical protein BDV33DRAFT_183340 [Aspergillus novoparasiticus]
MNTLDTLAIDYGWVHGAVTKPFTAIVTLYMGQRLALEIAVQEIVSVINEVYYGGDSDLGIISQSLSCLCDMWHTDI